MNPIILSEENHTKNNGAVYKRLELHNHTTESDASITCEQLMNLMTEDRADAFALTDHNTISGHVKMKALLQESNSSIQCIYGMEYTTYYGHILCLNLTEYVPWENINFHRPELLFQAVREKGALAGIAHPYSYGYPFARGCRFEMTVKDYSCVDFIEIFNDPEPLHEVNEKGLLLWEDLVLKGHCLAMTSGMDLHGFSSMHNQYATFIKGEPGGDISRELEEAIHSQQTWVSRGPILETAYDKETGALSFRLIPTGKPGFPDLDEAGYLVSLKTDGGALCVPLTQTLPLTALKGASLVIPKLFHGNTELENLICVAPVIHL